MSTSFGLCEASLGSSGNSFLNSLWQQAAAQGITVFVSSGDNGAAGCDSASASTATHGRGVNGLCSTPYSVCVGGTEFNDISTPSLYWSASNVSGTQASAISYIPEVVWNESGPGAGLWASGGGASSIYAKPSWQAGMGVPADGKRDVPDVSLTAAGHDGYLIYQEGGTLCGWGDFGRFALVCGSHGAGGAARCSPAGQRQCGVLLFGQQAAGGRRFGFSRHPQGQQQCSGTSRFQRNGRIRSGHRAWLHRRFCSGESLERRRVVPAFQATASASSVSVTAGSNNSIKLNVIVSGGFDAAVAFSVTGLPSGVSAAFTPTTLPAPGSGSSVLKLTASSSVKAGVYSVTVLATSGSSRQQMPVSVTVVRTVSRSVSVLEQH